MPISDISITVIPKRSNPASIWKFIPFEREVMTMLNLHTLNSTLNSYATTKAYTHNSIYLHKHTLLYHISIN